MAKCANRVDRHGNLPCSQVREPPRPNYFCKAHQTRPSLGASLPAASGDSQRATVANACRAPMYQANRWLEAPYEQDRRESSGLAVPACQCSARESLRSQRQPRYPIGMRRELGAGQRTGGRLTECNLRGHSGLPGGPRFCRETAFCKLAPDSRTSRTRQDAMKIAIPVWQGRVSPK